MLEGKAGKKVTLDILKPDGKTVRASVKPISGGAESNMAYQRWIERNEHIADSLSGGKIGYVHVRGMDGESFQTVYDRILGKYRNCDAIVVDTRYNGGGWLHNDLAVLLSGKEYVKFKPRGREIGHEPFAQWVKAVRDACKRIKLQRCTWLSVHLQDSRNRRSGRQPDPGTMTAVWWETQIDPTIVFGIPQVTNVSMDGTVLENTQLNPDILIYNRQADIERGVDAQLEGAVRHLMEKTKK